MIGMRSSTCILDPIPSNLVKDCLPALSPLITQIIKSSFSSGSVPYPLKLVAVTPILKKPGLDPDTMSNFRPISNLPFLSKLLERVVASQLNAHLYSNDLFEPFQSGFRSQPHRISPTSCPLVPSHLTSSSLSLLTFFLFSPILSTLPCQLAVSLTLWRRQE